MNRSVLDGVESMAFQLLGSRFTIELRSGGLFSLLAWLPSHFGSRLNYVTEGPVLKYCCSNDMNLKSSLVYNN